LGGQLMRFLWYYGYRNDAASSIVIDSAGGTSVVEAGGDAPLARRRKALPFDEETGYMEGHMEGSDMDEDMEGSEVGRLRSSLSLRTAHSDKDVGAQAWRYETARALFRASYLRLSTWLAKERAAAREMGAADDEIEWEGAARAAGDGSGGEWLQRSSDGEDGTAGGRGRSSKYIARPLAILLPRWRERMSLDNVRRCQQNWVLAMRRRVREEKELRKAGGGLLFDKDKVMAARDPIWGGGGGDGRIRLTRSDP